MQKALLLLPLLCLVLCSADDMAEGQEVPDHDQPSDPSNPLGQLIWTPNSYPCPTNYTELTRDTQLFNDVVCVKTSIKEATLIEGDCPAGTATISYDEVWPKTNLYCNLLIDQNITVARIEAMGLIAHDYANGCHTSNYDDILYLGQVKYSLCVEREIEDTKIVPAIDDLCGPGQVLVTPQEVLANFDDYCILAEDYIVRLANGGSLESLYDCTVHYEDRRDLEGVLCRNLTVSS